MRKLTLDITFIMSGENRIAHAFMRIISEGEQSDGYLFWYEQRFALQIFPNVFT